MRNLWIPIEVNYRYQRGHNYLHGIQARKDYLGGRRPDHIYYKLQTGDVSDELIQNFQTAVQQLSAWSAQANIPMYTAYIPDASQLHEPRRQVANKIVAEGFRQAHQPFLDTTPSFDAHPDPKSLFLFPLDAHTSPEGHRLIATAIFEDVQFTDLLNAVSGP